MGLLSDMKNPRQEPFQALTIIGMTSNVDSSVISGAVLNSKFCAGGRLVVYSLVPNLSASALAVFGPIVLSLSGGNCTLNTPISYVGRRPGETMPNGSRGAQTAVTASNSSMNGSKRRAADVPPHVRGGGLYEAGRAEVTTLLSRIFSMASESQWWGLKGGRDKVR